ncbi:RNA 2',3'-cyclic phosphodiesterase [Rosistilla oblonga]|uniref:RNA 2',3'-cyclic phosphodiesterase n=1 Tax=Rosistilla oblonga TaxID=2527990 RepID=UPI003A9850BC
MQKIRSFIAIPLTDEIQNAAGRMVDRLREPATGVKWVDADNLHLTLKFLGDVDNIEVPDVCKALRKCCANAEPFSLSIQGIGGFPDLQRARVVWAGVEDQSSGLCPLAESIDIEMGKLGFKREFRDYTPHLTLGRLKKGSRLGEDFIAAAEKEADTELGTIHVQEVHVFASFMDKHQKGPTYNVMDRVALD